MFDVTTVECAGPMRITLFLGRAICWWKGAHVDRTNYVVADPAVMWRQLPLPSGNGLKAEDAYLCQRDETVD